MAYLVNLISSMIRFFDDIKRVSISQWDVEHKDYSKPQRLTEAKVSKCT